MLSAALAPLAVQLAVLTMTPGSDLFARFGHTAVRVDDGVRVRVYNYGTFNSADPKIAGKFLHNRVDYWLSSGSWEPFLARYADRDITVQELALSDAEAQRAAAYLEWNVLPENRAYRYDWFRNNCSTKVRDLLDYATGGVLKRQLAARPGERTIRGVLDKVLTPLPSVFFMMDIGLNRRVDEPVSRFDELAMPADLMNALTEVTRADGAALVARSSTIVGPEPRPKPEPIPIARVLLGALLVLLVLGLRLPRAARIGGITWGALSGLLALWFYIWWLLPYPDTFLTGNAWLWGPAAILIFTRGRWAKRVLIASMALGVIEIASHVLGGVRQAHWGYTAYALTADALVLVALRQRERVLRGWGEAPAERAA